MDVSPERPFAHHPVMADEIVALFAPAPEGWVIDATLGGGGHAEAILDAHPHLRVLGIDRDPSALAAADARLSRFGERVRTVRGRFDAMADLASGTTPVSGVLFDLGVSSPQLDRPERGFSYRHDGPLDMRMDPDVSVSASTVVNDYPQARLAAVLRDLGDERYAGRIARAVVAARPVATTTELAEIVRDAIPAPARRTGGHPAKRSFQAIRIEVNEELTILAAAIDAAIDLIDPDGRLAVLAYHSGEDRIVKARLRSADTGDCACPPGLPCVCGATPSVRLLKRGTWKPTAEEIASNPRAESARLRAAVKLEVTA